MLYYLLYVDDVGYVLEVRHNTSIVTLSSETEDFSIINYRSTTSRNVSAGTLHRQSEVTPIRLFPRSTYDTNIVNWTRDCIMSPAYLADLAFTLKQITDVLEEFGIVYVFDSGTLLGALRMNGPLPYDDDIDITVLEEDFKPKKDLVYDAMRKRNFKVMKQNGTSNIDQFIHINKFSPHGFYRPYIDIFMLRESDNKIYLEFVVLYFRRLALCPFKKSTIFGQAPPLSTPIPTISASRAPQVIPRALEAAWYHNKDIQRKTRGVIRPGLQKILHHRYGTLSTVMFLGRLYPVAADPFAYADCLYRDWHTEHTYHRQHPAETEPEKCRKVSHTALMAPSQYYISSHHKKGAAISAYVMLQRLKETMCYQAKESADIMLQGNIVNKYNNSIVTIEEEFNATDTMLFRQMCSMDETLCSTTFTC